MHAGPEPVKVEEAWFVRLLGKTFRNKIGDTCGIIGYNKVSKLLICVDDTQEIEISMVDLKQLHRLEVEAAAQAPVQMPAAPQVPPSSPTLAATLSDEYIAAKLTGLTGNVYVKKKFDSVG